MLFFLGITIYGANFVPSAFAVKIAVMRTFSCPVDKIGTFFEPTGWTVVLATGSSQMGTSSIAYIWDSESLWLVISFLKNWMNFTILTAESEGKHCDKVVLRLTVSFFRERNFCNHSSLALNFSQSLVLVELSLCHCKALRWIIFLETRSLFSRQSAIQSIKNASNSPEDIFLPAPDNRLRCDYLP